MGAMVTVHVDAIVEADVQKRAVAVLEREGLTVEQAVEQMLTRTANEGELPFESESSPSMPAPGENPGYDAWFCAKVQEAVDDLRPMVSNEEAQQRWAAQKADLIARAEATKRCA